MAKLSLVSFAFATREPSAPDLLISFLLLLLLLICRWSAVGAPISQPISAGQFVRSLLISLAASPDPFVLGIILLLSNPYLQCMAAFRRITDSLIALLSSNFAFLSAARFIRLFSASNCLPSNRHSLSSASVDEGT